jgi:hypothetical protein
MNGENELEQKNLKKKIAKKHSLQEKTKTHNFNKHFPIIQKTKIMKAYSTKTISNFVPTLRPKQSFCKPTFMQLNKNQPKFENENEDSDLDEITSSEGIDELDSDSNKSSSITSSNDENDKEKHLYDDIQMNSISCFKLNNMNFDKDEDKIIKGISENKIFTEDKSNLQLTNNDNNNTNILVERNDENKINTSKKRCLSILDILKNKNKIV